MDHDKSSWRLFFYIARFLAFHSDTDISLLNVLVYHVSSGQNGLPEGEMAELMLEPEPESAEVSATPTPPPSVPDKKKRRQRHSALCSFASYLFTFADIAIVLTSCCSEMSRGTFPCR